MTANNIGANCAESDLTSLLESNPESYRIEPMTGLLKLPESMVATVGEILGRGLRHFPLFLAPKTLTTLKNTKKR